MTDQEYLDRCAIEAMGARLAKFGSNGLDSFDVLAQSAYIVADAMLAERMKRMEGERV